MITRYRVHPHRRSRAARRVAERRSTLRCYCYLGAKSWSDLLIWTHSPPMVVYMYRRVAALGEALSVTFRVTLVQTVSRRPLTISHDLSRPPHRQRRPTRSPRRPHRFSRQHSGAPIVSKDAQDGQEKRSEHRGELNLAVFPHRQRPAQAAVSCTATKTR